MIWTLRTIGSHAPLQCPQLQKFRTEGGNSVPRVATEPWNKPGAYIEHAELLAAAYAALQFAAQHF